MESQKIKTIFFRSKYAFKQFIFDDDQVIFAGSVKLIKADQKEMLSTKEQAKLEDNSHLIILKDE